MPKETPAFQFYPDDFLGGTQDFTACEVGGYLRLLIHQSKKGAIPGDNVRRLAQIMGMSPSAARSAWAVIAEKFKRGEDGQWRNAKLERVIANRERYSKEQSDRGRKGGHARWQKRHEDSGTHSESDSGSHGRTMASATKKDGERHSERHQKRWPDLWQSDGSPIKKEEEGKGSKNDPLPPPGDLLAVHQRLFVEKYGLKPQYDGPKDAAIAKKLIQKHGFEQASRLLECFFASADPWLSKSGHGMGLLGSATTVNKLIADLSARAGATRDPGLERTERFLAKAAAAERKPS